MLDIKFIRENPAAVKKALASRKTEADIDGLLAIDAARRSAITKAEELKSERNAASKAIGGLMKEGKKAEAEAAKEEVRLIGDRIAALDEQVREFDEKILHTLLFIPNLPLAGVPVGESADDNVVVRTWGEAKKFDFKIKPHWDICEALKLVDFERGTKITGSGFPVYTGQGARLQRGLIQFMLDLHTSQHGYTEVSPPFLVGPQCLEGVGQFPKFADQYYAVQEGLDSRTLGKLYLIPTAETPVGRSGHGRPTMPGGAP